MVARAKVRSRMADLEKFVIAFDEFVKAGQGANASAASREKFDAIKRTLQQKRRQIGVVNGSYVE